MESVDRNNRHIGSMSATLAMVPLLASLLLPGTATRRSPTPLTLVVAMKPRLTRTANHSRRTRM